MRTQCWLRVSYRVQGVYEGPFRQLLQSRHVNRRVPRAGQVIIGRDRCRHRELSEGLKTRAFQMVSRSGVVQQCLNPTPEALSSVPLRRLLRSAVKHHFRHYMAGALSISPRECLSQLQGPIHDIQTLTNLLASSLAAYNILLPRYQQFVETSIPLSRTQKAARLIPQFQLAILEQVLPNWEQTLEENSLMSLVQQWFCPINCSSEYAADVARHALPSILGVPLRQSTVITLQSLLYHYPLSAIYCHFFPVSGGLSMAAIDWDEYLKDIFSLPAKVANINGLGGIQTPEQLETRFVAPLCSQWRSDQILGRIFLTYVRGPRKSSGAYLIALVSKV